MHMQCTLGSNNIVASLTCRHESTRKKKEKKDESFERETGFSWDVSLGAAALVATDQNYYLLAPFFGHNRAAPRNVCFFMQNRAGTQNLASCSRDIGIHPVARACSEKKSSLLQRTKQRTTSPRMEARHASTAQARRIWR